MNYREKYEKYRGFAEVILREATERMECLTPILQESVAYSLLAGGKRIRPVLFMAMLDALGFDYRAERIFPVALECIHTYSLIHDDLPAMDNDDFRRGKPSSHKVFGEAHAILAGDGLLSYAFDLLIGECVRGNRAVAAAKTLARAAGVRGMVAGQSADLLYSGRPLGEVGEEELHTIHTLKTAEMISAPLEMAANLAGKYEAEAREFGLALGLLFQITDDILDEVGESETVGKTLGKDREEGKLTCVRLYGVERANVLADEYAQSCLDSLKRIDGNMQFFEELVRQIRSRER